MRWSTGRQNVTLSRTRWNVFGLDWGHGDFLTLLRLMLLGSCGGSGSLLETSQVPEIRQSEGKESGTKGASPTSSVDLVSLVGTHRCTGCLARCSACKPASDPRDSRVHIGPCELYRHRSLEHTSVVDYDPTRWLTGWIRGKRIILWD